MSEREYHDGQADEADISTAWNDFSMVAIHGLEEGTNVAIVELGGMLVSRREERVNRSPILSHPSREGSPVRGPLPRLLTVHIHRPMTLFIAPALY